MNTLQLASGQRGLRLIATVRDRGVPLTDHELTGLGPSDGTTYRVSYWPVRNRADELIGVSAMVVDITADKQAERERERLLARERRAADRVARLQRVTAALTGALSVTDVAEVMVREATAAVDMPKGWVALLTAGRTALEWQASIGFDESARERYGRVAVTARSPGPDAVRTRRARYFSTPEEHAARIPGTPRVVPAGGQCLRCGDPDHRRCGARSGRSDCPAPSPIRSRPTIERCWRRSPGCAHKRLSAPPCTSASMRPRRP